MKTMFKKKVLKRKISYTLFQLQNVIELFYGFTKNRPQGC